MSARVNEGQRLYLAGKMRGLPEHGFPAFRAAATFLRSRGWEVWSPAEHDEAEGFDPVNDTAKPLKDYMATDLYELCRSGAVVVLPGWEDSQGARLEVHVARECDIPVWRYPDLEPVPATQVSDIEVPGLPEWLKARGLVLATASDAYRMTCADCGHMPDTPQHELGCATGRAEHEPDGPVRAFASGATRNRDEHKPDYEAFLSPLVIREFGRYMHEHRRQADGSLRAGDNWQRGFPRESYVKSMFRHFLDVWTLHDGYPVEDYDGKPVDMREALCAVLFNASGLLHEVLLGRGAED